MSGGWYSVQELAGLPGMPGSERGAFKALKKNLCVARSKESGKGREYPLTCLPKETQAALLARELAAQAGKPPFHTPATPATPSLPATTSPTPVAARPVSAPADLTDRQRHIEGARKYVLAEVSLLMAQVGCGREAAMHALLVNAAAGTAEAQVMAALALARDTRGRKRAAGAEAPRPLPSVRTLKRWLAADVAGVPCSLAPRVARQKMDVPPWAGAFLTHYQQPQKPSVDAAYRAFLAEAVIQGAAIDTLPSIHQIRRLIQKIGAVTLERGRSGARELKNIRPFVRRSFDHLEPNDIWSADGHTFDAEVQHPYHGRPFRPEITSIVDIATRAIVGWSVGLAESAVGVVDALRMGVEQAGIPAIFYVDNGSGFANAMLSDEGTGLAGRVGFSVMHSLPYNSQARGVIERLHQTVWVDAAKMLPTYMGASMDREARLAQFKLTRTAMKGGADGRARALPLMPWDVFVDFCRERVQWYNQRAHRALKNTSPALRLAEFNAKGWQAMRLPVGELDTLFRPRVARTLKRGEIILFTNIYACPGLAEFHGEVVHVAYDLHKPEKIWVYSPEGRYMGEALADGNRKHYYPVAVVQQQREARARGREKRVLDGLTEIREELHGHLLDTTSRSFEAGMIDLGTRVMPVAEAIEQGRVLLASDTHPAPLAVVGEDYRQDQGSAPVRVLRSTRTVAENMAEWEMVDACILAGHPVDEGQAYWHESYQHTAQFKSEARRRAEQSKGETETPERRGVC